MIVTEEEEEGESDVSGSVGGITIKGEEEGLLGK